MRKAFFISLLLTAAFVARGQEPPVQFRFNPEFSTQDIRLEVGSLIAPNGGAGDAYLLRGFYTTQFWKQLAYRLGGQLSIGDLGGGIGFPCGIALRPGVVSWRQSLTTAAEMAVFDSVWLGYHGYGYRAEDIGYNFFMRLLLSLFRRTEYHVGLTPAVFLDQDWEMNVPSRVHFLLTADAGIVLSIPIWRLCLNVSPTYHFALINTGTNPARHLFSITGGVSYLF